MCLVTVTGYGGVRMTQTLRRPHRATCEPHDRGADPAAIRQQGHRLGDATQTFRPTKGQQAVRPNMVDRGVGGVGLNTELKSSISFLCCSDLWSLEVPPPPFTDCWALGRPSAAVV